jgi:hypothetical protein
VALDTGANGKFLSKRLKPNLKFTFKPDMRVQPPAPVVRAALGSSPVAEAPPHGEPPNKLNRALNAAAAQHLDFALVRLSSQVTHVPPIDIKEPAAAEEHRKCTVIGYAGGTAIKLDIDLVTRVHQASARLLHLANTVAGMSGSCCVGPSGMPVGLHEGGFYKLDANGNVVLNANQQVMVENNRAVCLSNIRDVLRAMDPDPLLAKPRTAGGGILNPALVVAWQRAGERLAGVGLVAAWNDLVAHALGVAIADIGATQSFHPWFTRKAIEDWIDARRTNTADRVAFINGDRGTGKSFSIHILAAKLDDPVRDLVVLTATQTSAWSWREAVTNLPRGTHGDPALRTDVGAVKYEDIGSIIAGLRDYGGIDRTLGNEPLFVAIDFEDARDLKLEGPPWLEFIKQLAMQPWIRLMIIGLADGERRTLDKIFENEAGTASMFSVQIDLTHVDRAELTLFLRALYGDQGRPANNAQINADLKAWTAQTWLRARRPELQTAEAVLFALAARRQILASAAAEPARGGN